MAKKEEEKKEVKEVVEVTESAVISITTKVKEGKKTFTKGVDLNVTVGDGVLSITRDGKEIAGVSLVGSKQDLK